MSSPSTVTVSSLSSSPFTSTTNVTEDALSSTQASSTPSTFPEIQTPSLPYVASEAVVAFLAITGNLLVIYVFCTNRSLRRYRNYYIVGLAFADSLVGLVGIPLAVLASVGLPRNLYGCLFSLSILMILCTISILCLVAVSIDRYWATTNPFAYYRNMTTTTAVGIILSCWFVGGLIGGLPLFGWYNHDGWSSPPGEFCYFTKVISYSYLVFLYFATIVFPALLMACFYGYIYHVVLIKIRQKGTLAPQGRRQSEASRSGSLNSDSRGSTQMMRIIQSEKRREAKAAKKLGIIVLFFILSWIPLYTINCIQAFVNFPVPEWCMYFTIILSHANSALNPFLYAYHLKEFRLAMKNALCCFFGRLLCGLINPPNQKDSFGLVSRSQTMPSLANASLSTQTGKFSIKFRKVSGAQSSSSDAGGGQQQRISPKGGGGGGALPGKSILSTPSRDSLFNIQLSTTDKSMASLSLINEPLTSHLPMSNSNSSSSSNQCHLRHNHYNPSHKESSFTNFIQNNTKEDRNGSSGNSNSNNISKQTKQLNEKDNDKVEKGEKEVSDGPISVTGTGKPNSKGRKVVLNHCSKESSGGKSSSAQSYSNSTSPKPPILETDIQVQSQSQNGVEKSSSLSNSINNISMSDTPINSSGNVNANSNASANSCSNETTDSSSQIVLHWKTSPTFSLEV